MISVEISNIERAAANLLKNGFHVVRCANAGEATEFCLAQAEPGMTAGSGGSMTLQEMGLLKKLEAKGVQVIYHVGHGLSPAERRLNMRRELMADLYFCSANAITEDGWIFNTDGAGNRVAATILGPEHIYIVAGINKIVSDLAAAERHVAEIAPLNCQRLHYDTPCAQTGVCEDCDSPDRSCRVQVILKRPPRTVDITVVLVDEKLGY